MATIIIDCSSATNTYFKSIAQIRLTYTCENGTLAITKIEGRKKYQTGDTNDSCRSDDTKITAYINNDTSTTKTITLTSGCVYFVYNTSSTTETWKNFGTFTSAQWAGLTSSPTITLVMPSSTDTSAAYRDAKFTSSTITMTWNGVVQIDTGSGFVKAIPYIDNGTEWKQAIPYIDNGSTWKVCE